MYVDATLLAGASASREQGDRAVMSRGPTIMGMRAWRVVRATFASCPGPSGGNTAGAGERRLIYRLRNAAFAFQPFEQRFPLLGIARDLRAVEVEDSQPARVRHPIVLAFPQGGDKWNPQTREKPLEVVIDLGVERA